MSACKPLVRSLMWKHSECYSVLQMQAPSLGQTLSDPNPDSSFCTAHEPMALGSCQNGDKATHVLDLSWATFQCSSWAVSTEVSNGSQIGAMCEIICRKVLCKLWNAIQSHGFMNDTSSPLLYISSSQDFVKQLVVIRMLHLFSDGIRSSRWTFWKYICFFSLIYSHRKHILRLYLNIYFN